MIRNAGPDGTVLAGSPHVVTIRAPDERLVWYGAAHSRSAAAIKNLAVMVIIMRVVITNDQALRSMSIERDILGDLLMDRIPILDTRWKCAMFLYCRDPTTSTDCGVFSSIFFYRLTYLNIFMDS